MLDLQLLPSYSQQMAQVCLSFCNQTDETFESFENAGEWIFTSGEGWGGWGGGTKQGGRGSKPEYPVKSDSDRAGGQ